MKTDADIRRPLVKYLREKDPDAVILHEVQIDRGSGRADVAAVNGSLVGYEIKSERDTLRRIVSQRNHYDSVFDYTTIVVASNHLDNVRKAVPSKWGILVATASNDAEVTLTLKRRPRLNRKPDPHVLVRLLWKTECYHALRTLGLGASASMPVRRMWEALASIPTTDLQRIVRQSLIHRRRSD